jgi:hypothetical protein
MNPIPYAVSILWGTVTAFALCLITIPLSLAEMGHPINWAVAYLVVAGLMLAFTTYTARAKGALAGGSCGILFSAPIAGACYLIAHRDVAVLREHGRELEFAGIATLAISVLLMSCVAQVRKAPLLADERNKKF